MFLVFSLKVSNLTIINYCGSSKVTHSIFSILKIIKIFFQINQP